MEELKQSIYKESFRQVLTHIDFFANVDQIKEMTDDLIISLASDLLDET